jgi:glycosyltransferase involved in cell wall biosynthesis
VTAGPAVSVLMTTYNREPLIGAAVASILSQTLRDLELVIVDDGSTDDTATTVEAFGDPRVRLIRLERNQGIPAGRNTALAAARGNFVAWLDSDDVARPDRLELQLTYMHAHPRIAMVGSCAGKLDENGTRKAGVRVPPLTHDDIRCWLLFRSAFQQSSVLGRGDVLRAFPYRVDYPVCEDVDMFVRLSAVHRVANMADVLVDRRIHAGQTVRQNRDPILDAQSRISGPLLDSLGLSFSAEDLHRHVLLGGSFDVRPDTAYLEWAAAWLRQLIAANGISRQYDPSALRFCTSFLWVRACARSTDRLGGAGRMLSSSLTTGIASAHGRAWLRQALPLLRRG